jgi:hypothetical protein
MSTQEVKTRYKTGTGSRTTLKKLTKLAKKGACPGFVSLSIARYPKFGASDTTKLLVLFTVPANDFLTGDGFSRASPNWLT